MKLSTFTRMLRSKRSLPSLGSEIALELQTLSQEKLAPFSFQVLIDADAPCSLVDHVTHLFADVPDYVNLSVSYNTPCFDDRNTAAPVQGTVAGVYSSEVAQCKRSAPSPSTTGECDTGAGVAEYGSAAGAHTHSCSALTPTLHHTHALSVLPRVPEFDFCIVICGFSASSAYAYQRACENGIPCALLSLTPRLCLELAQFAQIDIPTEDIMARAALPEQEQVRVIEKRLAQWLLSVLPEKKLTLCNAFPFVRGVAARSEVSSCAVQNSAIGLVHLIPGADLPLMTVNQVKMLLRIASMYGHELDFLQALQVVGVGAFAFVSRSGARSALRALPGFAQLIRASVALGSTCVIGWALIAYYEHAAASSAQCHAISLENENVVASVS